MMHRRQTVSCKGCTSKLRDNGTFKWTIDPNCPYHKIAAQYPQDHSIPWNCPTYHDGCNCAKVIRRQKNRITKMYDKIEELNEYIRDATS